MRQYHVITSFITVLCFYVLAVHGAPIRHQAHNNNGKQLSFDKSESKYYHWYGQ